MNRVFLFVLGAGLTLVVAAWFARQERAASEARFAAQRAQWQAERIDLEAALDSARAQLRPIQQSPTAPKVEPASAARRPTPEEIVATLQTLKPGGARESRLAVYWLEELTFAGPAALPAIRGFLGRYVDIDLDPGQLLSKAPRDRMPMEFAVPPSLRFGFFEVLRRIGGAEATVILSESLARTGRGAEVAYLAAALQEMAPNQYREQATAVARSLLANATPVNTGSPLDRYHRDYLYGTLALLGDNGFVPEAQAQLVRADSQVDRSALKYLQQMLGAQAVPIVAQAYRSPMLTNSAGKEPLARLALSYVGADDAANAFYQQSINDPLLTRSHRKNLIEDLNQDGFADPKNLTAQDLPLIEKRIQLIESLAPKSMDDANAAAFQEAYKDLLNMRTKLTGEKPKPL